MAVGSIRIRTPFCSTISSNLPLSSARRGLSGVEKAVEAHGGLTCIVNRVAQAAAPSRLHAEFKEALQCAHHT